MKVSTFRIEKMDCPTEERLIRNRLSAMEGVDDLSFNLIARVLTVKHRLPEESSIVTAIGTLGMEAVAVGATPQLELQVLAPSFWRKPGTILTLVSGVCALVAEVLALTILAEDAFAVRALAAVAIVTGGYETAGKAWTSLRTLTLNIHFLMALAVVGAVALGEWAEAGMVVFLFAVAELIEAQSLNRARRAIRLLMELTPERALVLRGGGLELVPVEDIRQGERVRIKPGERLPLDGLIISGRSTFNQASITGESIPVERGVGERVFAGSINGSGTVDYEATHTAAESTISRIVQLVEKATVNRGRTERFVDRFSRYYTPAIFAVALLVAVLPPLLTGAAWDTWVYNGLVLLVIGCPCALVISTPVTVVSGLAAAARRGILVKGGEYLELGRVLRGVAFDKTGTLTEGRPRVTDVVSLDGLPDEDLLHLAAAVEAKSEHPIASAIIAAHELQHAAEGDLEISEFHAIPGRGASAVVDGTRIHVGSHRLAHDLGVCVPSLELELQRLETDGKTTVVVMTEQKVLGVIGVADTVRSSSVDAVRRLHELGLRSAILTGDNEVTAASIARRVGIDDVRANLLPDEKIVALAGLQREYGAMGMVGDGVNDVPALAQATVGFAMGAASADVALETADVALMNDDLRKLPEFIELSRRTIAVLKQNIWIALGLKGVFFALALAGEATLWMAVFADMGASLIVVANGLRLLGRGGATPVAAAYHHNHEEGICNHHS